MTMRTSLGIQIAPETGDAESRWLRLVPVEQQDQAATLAQAAELIDALYGIDACGADDLGTGGAAASDPIEQDEFLATARERLDLCRDKTYWEAEVDILRSHQGDGYSLECGDAAVVETAPVSRTVTETVEMDGSAALDLAWPYAGSLSVSGAVVRDVRGSTVNFARPVRGRVRLTYRTIYDRVRVRAAMRITEAALVAFWRDLAAECAVSPPPADDSIDAAALGRICNSRGSMHLVGDCWERVERYSICNCSGREAPEVVEETAPAPCPEGTAPNTVLGTTREMAGYVDCDRETEDLADPGYYLDKCCEPPTRMLPRCREMREPYRGGAEIEHGPDYYKNIYGESVVLTAVSPEGGCGEIVRNWQVAARDCGDTPPPGDCAGTPPPILPVLRIVAPGMTAELSVTGGLGPFTWSGAQLADLVGVSQDSRTAFFHISDEFGATRVTVTDACGRQAACRLRSPDDMADPDAPSDPNSPYGVVRAWRDTRLTIKTRWNPYPQEEYIMVLYINEREVALAENAMALFLDGPAVRPSKSTRRENEREFEEDWKCRTKKISLYVNGNKAIYGNDWVSRFTEKQWNTIASGDDSNEKHVYDTFWKQTRDYSGIVGNLEDYWNEPYREKGQKPRYEKAGVNSYYHISYTIKDGQEVEQSRTRYYYIITDYWRWDRSKCLFRL